MARPVRSVPWEREAESALGGRGGPGSSEGPEGGPASRAGRPRAAFLAGPLRTQPEPGKQLRGWPRAPPGPPLPSRPQPGLSGPGRGLASFPFSRPRGVPGATAAPWVRRRAKGVRQGPGKLGQRRESAS